VTFEVGDAHALPRSDRSYDAAVSLRVLMHTPDWRRCLGELCRVANDRVVFDYPAACSAAALQAGGRRLMAWFGSGTEAYRVLRAADVREALRAAGYRIEREHRQFVLPIAVHKMVNSRNATTAVEGALASMGLLSLIGSPVTVVAVRCER
jgi:ubiquinone/menaquinone biosynthesis C-methylase UbiE